MNIYELRRVMQVTNYHSHSEGGTIYYLREGKINVIILTRIELIKELISIGSMDEGGTSEEQIDYVLSQWDALNIAIRFEAARDAENDLDNSDILKALANIIKPNK